jgi:hypothetical protein
MVLIVGPLPSAGVNFAEILLRRTSRAPSQQKKYEKDINLLPDIPDIHILTDDEFVR